MNWQKIILSVYFVVSILVLILFQPNKLKIIINDFTNIYFLFAFILLIAFAYYMLTNENISYQKKNATRAALSAFVIAYLAKLKYVFSCFAFVYIMHSFDKY